MLLGKKFKISLLSGYKAHNGWNVVRVNVRTVSILPFIGPSIQKPHRRASGITNAGLAITANVVCVAGYA